MEKWRNIYYLVLFCQRYLSIALKVAKNSIQRH